MLSGFGNSKNILTWQNKFGNLLGFFSFILTISETQKPHFTINEKILIVGRPARKV